MHITKEMLDEREAALRADMNAIAGALQDVAYFRSLIEKDEDDVPDVTQVLGAVGMPVDEIVEIGE